MTLLTNTVLSALAGAATTGILVAMAGTVSLQDASPGTPDAGHSNVSGNSLAARFGANTSPTLARVQIQEDGALQGLRAISGTGVAVYGQSNATTGLGAGGYFTSKSAGGRALVADQLSGTGNTVGGLFFTHSATSVSLWGTARGTTGSPVGVRGDSSAAEGIGVQGTGTGYGGVFTSTSPEGIALKAGTDTSTGAAIVARGTGSSKNSTVYSVNLGTNSFSAALFGRTFNKGSSHGLIVNRGVSENSAVTYTSAAATVYDVSDTGSTIGLGVRTSSPNGYSLYVEGPSTGNKIAIRAIGNTEATGTKSFLIDHPLDPENKSLRHFCAEGPEPTNVYSGTVKLGGDGSAWVQLPAYFEAINRDLRYQLTCVGGFSPVYVASEVSGNKFKIAGGKSGLKVSWQVTGVRNDAYVRHNGFKTEALKNETERGYLYAPEAYGRPSSRGVGAVHTSIRNPDGTTTVGGRQVADRP
ncbi:MAG: hypothetical protein JST30_11115 [Armatimonadetes bacterium]|nr:hypothetical protein [Armatimonadota bacterium]